LCLFLAGTQLVGCGPSTDAGSQQVKIDAVKNTRFPGEEPLGKLFLRHCEITTWRLYQDDQQREIVECKGPLKANQKEMIVRWHLLYQKKPGGSVSTAIPVYASLGGEEIHPPEDFRKIVFVERKKE
jgi:hypothetical protein